MKLTEGRRQELIALAVMMVLVVAGAAALTIKPRPRLNEDPRIGADIVRVAKARGEFALGPIMGCDWTHAIVLVPGEDWRALEKEHRTWFPRGVFAEPIASSREKAAIVFLGEDRRPTAWTTIRRNELDLAALPKRVFEGLYCAPVPLPGS